MTGTPLEPSGGLRTAMAPEGASHPPPHPEEAPMTETVARRIGFRGRALTLFGAVWVLIGVLVAQDPVLDLEHPILLELLPHSVRVALWISAGTAALITAWWPPGSDRMGFIALVVPAGLRTGSYGWSAVMGAVTDQNIGDATDWPQAIAWGLVVALVLLIARWPEPGDSRGA